MSEYIGNAVAFGDLKNAALYFESLVPVYAVTEFVKAREWPFFARDVLPRLLPPQLVDQPGFAEALAHVNQRSFNWFAKMAAKRFNLEPRFGAFTSEEYERIEDDAIQAYFDFLSRFHLERWPLATLAGPATADMLDESEGETLPILTLSRINVVDASSAPWEQVHEFRKDTIAKDRLRRLRLFAYQNYAGKSRAFIEDDLLCRVADYEAAAKQWGLETVQGSLSLIVQSKVALGALVGGMAAALLGQPMAAVFAGTAGAVIEFGQVALEVQKRRMALSALSRDNPISYIAYVGEKLAPRSAG